MSIKKTSGDDSKMVLEFDNGDLKGLNQIMCDWNFKDEQSLLRFAMASMLKTSEKSLIITKDNGEKEEIVPVDEFLKT